MSALLTEALRGLGLQPGQTYRATVDGHAVEVRVLEDDAPSPGLSDQVMLQPWADFPTGPIEVATQARRAPLPLPDPPQLPPEDEVRE
jgi:hypothetical protein